MPFYDELSVGQVFEGMPSVALTDGMAAAHRAILGHRLPLALDLPLARRVVGGDALLAHPQLVCDVAIGHSTVVTERVIANLFYRGLRMRRAVVIGDTLTTRVEIVALRDSASRAAGLAALRISTHDQEGRPVLDFVRCALIPLSPGADKPGHGDDMDAVRVDAGDWAPDWDLSSHPRGPLRPLTYGDPVISAPELCRLTLNIAGAHHDGTRGIDGRRLVYGGHTIGIAAAHLNRAVPGLAYIVGWHSCDHLAPVFENDMLRSTVTVMKAGRLSDLRVQTSSDSGPVLDWSLTALVA